MFDAEVYVQRRKHLKEKMGSGILLFLGNEESPMNYTSNPYRFRQDSSFLYYWGIDYPALAAVLDVDQGREIIFGNDLTMADIVWTGPQPSIKEKSVAVGVHETAPLDQLASVLQSEVKRGRRIHFLPQYQAYNILKLEQLLGIHPRLIDAHTSELLTRTIANQRNVKAQEEVREIERAIDITAEMHIAAMKMSKVGIPEHEIAGVMEGIAVSLGGNLAFPIIFSIDGETLHNRFYENVLKEGDIVVNDSGAESAMHYAGDITRTFPVSGKFSTRQKEIYQIILSAEEAAIKTIKPGLKFKEAHLIACKVLAAGLKDLGLMKGNTEEAVQAGAHALFFQCGVGHLLGLDVHDMENFGEQYVGYDDVTPRSAQFGLCYLRLVRALEPGFVVTVEPGLYFIPHLLDQWKAEKKFSQFINYAKADEYRDFGGMRVEEDFLVTLDGYRLLGKKIPRSVEEIEAICIR